MELNIKFDGEKNEWILIENLIKVLGNRKHLLNTKKRKLKCCHINLSKWYWILNNSFIIGENSWSKRDIFLQRDAEDAIDGTSEQQGRFKEN